MRFIWLFEFDEWKNSLGNKHDQRFAFFLQYWQQPLDIGIPIVVISCVSVPLVAMMFLLQGRISSDFNEEVFALGLTEEEQLEQNPRDQVHMITNTGKLICDLVCLQCATRWLIDCETWARDLTRTINHGHCCTPLHTRHIKKLCSKQKQLWF